MSEHRYAVLRRGSVGTNRPAVMAIQIDADGRLQPVKELGAMDEVHGYVTWRIYPGDTIEVMTGGMLSAITAGRQAPQGDPFDARDAWGKHVRSERP